MGASYLRGTVRLIFGPLATVTGSRVEKDTIFFIVCVVLLMYTKNMIYIYIFYEYI